MVHKAGWLAMAGVLAAVLTGCSTPSGPSTQPAPSTPTPTATTSPTPTPTPTLNRPTLTPPRQFDVVHTVRLSPVDQVTAGILTGQDFVTMSANTVWGINVHDGSVAFRTPLGGGNPSCWQQVVDTRRAYTITLDESSYPATVRVTAVDRADGAMAWTYQPPVGALLTGADCGTATSTLTLTKHGLVVSLSRTDQSIIGQPVSSLSWMLDPASGQPVWQTDTAVLATDGADFGVSVAIAKIPTPMGVYFYQASPVDLTTGEIGPAFWQTANSMQLAGRYQLAGRTGDDLILLAHTTGTIDTVSTVYHVSAATGQASSQPVATLQPGNLGDCQLAPPGQLVCTVTDAPTMAYGVSLADGSTVWQHPFKAANSTSPPLLFGGNLYGFDSDKHMSYVLDTVDGTVLQAAPYPPAIAVNEAGLVFVLPQADQMNAWQCWWAPALA